MTILQWAVVGVGGGGDIVWAVATAVRGAVIRAGGWFDAEEKRVGDKGGLRAMIGHAVGVGGGCGDAPTVVKPVRRLLSE